MSGTYYVYSLKDTSINPARPFYIAKGTGTRAGGVQAGQICYLYATCGGSIGLQTLEIPENIGRSERI